MIYSIAVEQNNTIKGFITFDCVTSFNRSVSANISQNPVESGFTISDNITVNNRKFTLTALATSFSIFNENAEIVWDGTKFAPKESIDPYDYLKLANQIDLLITTGTVFKLYRNSERVDEESLGVNPIDTFTNLVISDMSDDISANQSGVSEIKLQFEQLQIAYVDIDVLDSDLGENNPLLVGVKKSNPNVPSSSTNTNATEENGKSIAEKTGDPTDVKKENTRSSSQISVDEEGRKKRIANSQEAAMEAKIAQAELEGLK